MKKRRFFEKRKEKTVSYLVSLCLSSTKAVDFKKRIDRGNVYVRSLILLAEEA